MNFNFAKLISLFDRVRYFFFFVFEVYNFNSKWRGTFTDSMLLPAVNMY